jgi:hypothetical protein
MLGKYRLLFAALLISVLTGCGSRMTTGTTAATGADTTTNTQTQSTSQSVNLAWRAPATRTDGSYLPNNDLAGYRVYMGTASNNLAPLVDLNDETITSYSVGNLPAGSYYFAVSAYDTDGLESSFSQILKIVIS